MSDNKSVSCIASAAIPLLDVLFVISGLNSDTTTVRARLEARLGISQLRGAVVVSGALLVIDLLKERLVQEELLFVHFLANLDLLLFHLLEEELLVVPVDFVDLIMKTFLLL